MVYEENAKNTDIKINETVHEETDGNGKLITEIV